MSNKPVKKARTSRAKSPAAGPPVVVYPVNGCQAVGMLTEQELEQRMRELRNLVRMYWNQPALKAVVELAELRTVRLTRQALLPEGTEHDRGQAYALNEFVGLLTQIKLTVEEE